MLFACDNVQLQMTKCYAALQPQVACLQVSENVLQFLFSVPHCHRRSQSRHRSSNLGNVTECPSSCSLLESERSSQLLRLINATSVCKHDMCLSKCLPFLTIAPVVFFLPSKSPAQSESTCTCNDAVRQHRALVLRQVPTQPVEPDHVSTSWFFHVSRERHFTASETSNLS